MSNLQLPAVFSERLKEAESKFTNNDVIGALQVLLEIENEGCHWARVEIGNIYELGGDGVERDPSQALRWYQKAVESTDDIYAHLAMGRLYANGEGIGINYEKAFTHFERAAKQLPAAQIGLGLLFHRGAGRQRDLMKARQYFQMAAEAGYPLAIRFLASVEMECGNRVKGLFLILKAGVTASVLSMKNPRDERLMDLVPRKYLMTSGPG